jgi:hypothetical protein
MTRPSRPRLTARVVTAGLLHRPVRACRHGRACPGHPRSAVSKTRPRSPRPVAKAYRTRLSGCVARLWSFVVPDHVDSLDNPRHDAFLCRRPSFPKSAFPTPNNQHYSLAETQRSLRQGQGRFSRPLRCASKRALRPDPKARKKLHKTAAKQLKSLARVNLCAPPFVLAHCSKLAFGPASASARPTSSPRSSIEVCSRTERSSPFACRSACSGERATLTVTFDSTSGCK